MRAYSCRLGPSLADCATGHGNVRGESCTPLPACNSRGSIGSTHNGGQDEVTGKLVVSLLAQPGLGYSRLRCATVLRKQEHDEQAGAFLQPSHKCVGCSRGAFVALRALYPVQNFVALVDSWSSLLLASKADPVVEVADDAPIPAEMELWREIKLNRHARKRQGRPEVSPKDLLRRGIHFCIRGAYSAS
jgi:hypothetical protein